MMSQGSQADTAQNDLELLIFWLPYLKYWVAVVWFSLFETGSHYVTRTGLCLYLLTWNYWYEPPHLAEARSIRGG